MIRTKNLVSSIEQVPIAWIFEFYLSLPERLTGQDVKIKSMLSARDMQPSFFIYFSSTLKKYKWKDFSAGKQGDAIELIKELYKLEYRYDAIAKIVKDYNTYVEVHGEHTPGIFKMTPKYEVKFIKLRPWYQGDVKYWTQYHIGSKILTQFNVKPLEYFKIARKGGHSELLTIKSGRIYGYFRADGTLYKIYQPKNKDNKFFKVENYIQGADQLTYTKPYLVICSSLKDGMALTKLDYKNIEFIAPDSENVILKENNILKLQKEYVSIATMFDNDHAGLLSMHRYKEQYGIPFAHFKYEKDLADCVKTHGPVNTKELLTPVLTKALRG